MAVQVIAQIGDAPKTVMCPPALQPARGSRQLAILLVMTVQGLDEFRRQSNGLRLARSHQNRGHCDVAVAGLAVLQDGLGAVGTGEFFRAEEVGAV